MEPTRKPGLSISQQADFLLDDSATIARKRSLELFSSVEEEILLSLQTEVRTRPAPQDNSESQQQYFMASRFGRPEYESLAKKEALMNALLKLRNSSRGTRNT